MSPSARGRGASGRAGGPGRPAKARAKRATSRKPAVAPKRVSRAPAGKRSAATKRAPARPRATAPATRRAPAPKRSAAPRRATARPRAAAAGAPGTLEARLPVPSPPDPAALERLQLLATILDVADVLVSIVGRDGEILSMNRACERTSGYTFEELRGKSFFDALLPPEDRERIRDVFARLGDAEPNIRAENDWITKTGERRRIVWSNAVVRDPHGRVLQLVGTGVDITEQHQAQAEARESGARYQMLFENASDGIFTVDPDGDRIVDVNAGGCEVIGLPRERLVGTSVRALLDPEMPFEPPPLDDLLSGRTVRAQLRLRRGDGRWIEAQIGSRALPDGRIISIVRDVTEQRRREEELRASEARHRALAEQLRASEAKYRNLHETMTDGFVRSSLDGRLVEFNESFRRMVGYAAEELAALTYRDLTPERWWDFEQRIRDEQVFPRGWSDVYQKEYRRKDGTVFPVELRTVLVRDDAGAPAGTWANVRDVTERRRAEQAVREGEARYRAVLDQASEGITLTDPEWRFLDVNARACEMFGYSREELLRMTVRDIGAAEDLALNPLHTAELRQGEAILTERTLRRKDGSRFTAEISARGLPDARVVSVVRDVTERRRMEQALRESEERSRRVLESDMMGIFFEQTGRIVGANDLALRLLGYNRNELLGGALQRTRLLRPEDAELEARTTAEMAATGVCRPHERDLVRRDGVRIPVLMGGAWLVRGGAEPQSVWFLLDLTGRKTAERRLAESQRYLERAHGLARIGTWDADLETMSATFSPEMEVIFGLPPGGGPVAFDAFRRAIHPDDWPEVEGGIQEQMRGAGSRHYVHRVVRPDGRVRVVEATSEPVLDEAGRAVRIIGAARDITEQRALEQQLREAQKLEAIGRLAGGVAHDFNNLLTVILGFTETLIEDLPAGDGRLSAEQIRTAARRAAGLTQQLLAFGRRQRFRLEVFDLNAVLEEMRDILRRLLGEHIEIAIEPDGRPARVRADRGQIEQVILNLALNARDAMPGGGRLGVVTRRGDCLGQARKDVPGVVLEVSDTGVGMSADVQAHIFEPFYTTKDVGRGTGLGLATVYGIVSQTGGEIEVESAPGRGSLFRVWLPLTESPAEAEPASVGPFAPRGTETLLLVEDEAAVRGLVAQLLRGWGYEVVEAGNGDEALALAGERPPDLLVSDVVMPGMSGPDLARRLTERRPGMRVLFISGYTHSVPEHALAGAGYLQKPFAPAALAHAVRDLLDAAPVGPAVPETARAAGEGDGAPAGSGNGAPAGSPGPGEPA